MTDTPPPLAQVIVRNTVWTSLGTYANIEPRVEAHILVAFLGYCLTMTLRMKLSASAPGLTPRAALQSLSSIQMLEVHVPTSDGRTLVMPRYTEPEAQQKLILEQLGLSLPPQPPPRIRAGKLELATTRE